VVSVCYKKVVKTKSNQVKSGINESEGVTIDSEEVFKKNKVNNVLSSTSGMIGHTK